MKLEENTNFIDDIEDVREIMRVALEISCRSVLGTLGPGGGNGMVQQGSHTYHTKDGMQCNYSVVHGNAVIEALCYKLRNLSQYMAFNVGDGTTSALVIQYALYYSISRVLDDKLKDVMIPSGISAAINKISSIIINDYIQNDDRNFRIFGPDDDKNLYSMDEDIKRKYMMSIAINAANGDHDFAKQIVDIFIDNKLGGFSKLNIQPNHSGVDTHIQAAEGAFLAASMPDTGFRRIDIDDNLHIENARVILLDGVYNTQVYEDLYSFTIETLSAGEELIILANKPFDPKLTGLFMMINSKDEQIVKNEDYKKIFETNKDPKITLLNCAQDKDTERYFTDLSCYLGCKVFHVAYRRASNDIPNGDMSSKALRDSVSPLIKKIVVKEDGAYFVSKLKDNVSTELYEELENRRQERLLQVEKEIIKTRASNLSMGSRMRLENQLKYRKSVLEGTYLTLRVGGFLHNSKEYNLHLATDIVESLLSSFNHGFTSPGQIEINRTISHESVIIIDKIMKMHIEHKNTLFRFNLDNTDDEDVNRRRCIHACTLLVEALRVSFNMAYEMAKLSYISPSECNIRHIEELIEKHFEEFQKFLDDVDQRHPNKDQLLLIKSHMYQYHKKFTNIVDGSSYDLYGIQNGGI